MAISNAVGSNNFNISFCLGVPWLFKSLFWPSSSHLHAVVINSASIFHSTAILIASCAILYAAFLITRFQLGYRVAFICIFSYIAYIVFAVTLEMHIFQDENLPHCPHTS